MSKQHTASVEITSRWDRPAVATGKGETWLVVNIKTGKRRKNAKRQPVDVSFVIDRSGSMNGQPLELAKRGVVDAIGLLDPTDSFGVIAYDHAIDEVVPLAPAGEGHKRAASQLVSRIETGGSTDLYGGWNHGRMQQNQPNWINNGLTRDGRIRRLVLLTDGLANVGLVDPSEIARRVAHTRVEGIATSTLGLGTGFDAAMLSGIAEAGGGNFAYVEYAKDLPAFFARELGEALTVVASRATLTLTLPKGVRARLLNPFPVDRVGKKLTISLGDLPAGMNLDLVFQITTRVKSEGVVPALTLDGRWNAVESEREVNQSVAIDPIMVISQRDFDAMPRDKKASQAAAEMIAADAKREAIAQFRLGNRMAAETVLGAARSFALSSPMVREDLISEIDTVLGFDPDSADFATQQRQVVNDEHRRSRGRDL